MAGPTPVQAPDRERVEERLHPLGRHDPEAVGLARVGGDLRDETVRADSDGDGKTALLADAASDLLRERAGRRERPEMVGHVEVRLVQRDGLHLGCDLSVGREDPVRLPPVARKVRPEEDGAGAEPFCLRRRHRRVDSETTRLVVGGGNNSSPFRVAANDHRPARQGGVVPHVHGCVVAVHVAVQDAADAPLVGHGLILAATIPERTRTSSSMTVGCGGLRAGQAAASALEGAASAPLSPPRCRSGGRFRT